MQKTEKEIPQRRLEDLGGETERVIARGTVFKGTIEEKDTVRLSGYCEGEIKSERLVRIDKRGKMDGSIFAPYVIIEGEIRGNITSAKHVELRKKGRVTGNISTEKFAMAEGSFLQGEIRMSRPGDTPAVFVEKRRN